MRIFACFCGREEITGREEDPRWEPFRGLHPGSRFDLRLLQKMESYLTDHCYVLIWFFQHLREEKSFSNLLIEFLRPPPAGSTRFFFHRNDVDKKDYFQNFRFWGAVMRGAPLELSLHCTGGGVAVWPERFARGGLACRVSETSRCLS